MDTKNSKRSYHKPTIERIDLVGEETAAVPNCKRSTGGGKNQTFPNPCRSTGRAAVICRGAQGS